MSKPKTKDEAHLRRKFKEEDEIVYEIERDARVHKRVWKRKTSKLLRKHAREDIRKALEGDE